MKWLAITLVIIAILLVSGIVLTTIRLYERRDDLTMSPLQVYDSLMSGSDVASVITSLNRPQTGDVGTFGGYDWPNSKASGVGGGLYMNNPTKLSLIPSSKYIPQTQEGRPSIVGLT